MPNNNWLVVIEFLIVETQIFWSFGEVNIDPNNWQVKGKSVWMGKVNQFCLKKITMFEKLLFYQNLNTALITMYDCEIGQF